MSRGVLLRGEVALSMIKEEESMCSTRFPAGLRDPASDGSRKSDGKPDGALDGGSDGSPDGARARILLVAHGTDVQLAGGTEALGLAGYDVDRVGDGEAALSHIVRNDYAVIVSDVSVAQVDALGLLRAARRRNLDVPLVVVTGAAEMGLAAVAVQQGALCFLEKPVPSDLLCETVSYACKLHELAILRRHAFDALGGEWSQMGDRVALEQVFEKAFEGFSIAFQPIISWSSRRVIGHEALLRSADPRLPNPASVLAVAERLGRVEQIGRLVRERVARSMTKAPAEFVFVNIHAHELLDSELFLGSAPLSQFGKRVVLEISEHALLDDIEHLEARAQALRKLGFRLAMDNLGPGYPGLSSFARLRPEYVKYDQSFVRGVDRDPVKADVVAKMTALFGTMNTRVIAAGIESIAERDAIIAAGVDLLQGFAFSRPDTAYRQPDLG
jgi:EAL domain-containing protein (putative c-di-GMP-specific phosphodiesterase class I)